MTSAMPANDFGHAGQYVRPCRPRRPKCSAMPANVFGHAGRLYRPCRPRRPKCSAMSAISAGKQTSQSLDLHLT
ncbi:hypothetical protein BpHYR1_040945 [Brachionus plicatilis]|uniref:Uncharacterized protein n=1 Tax=Brachionus plicatilis TaxID=10195 RepID=A0A3M7QI38_BRAPC|nr:hypothetical protein BpHYR1_040945 [Brachionus plicatilis]